MKRKKQQFEVQRRVGQKIKQARVEAGLTQIEVAKHLGMTGPGFGYIEAGNRRIDLLTLETIAKAVRKPLDYFLVQKKFAVEGKLLEIDRHMTELKKILMAARKSGGGRTR